ncbi:MAG: hypothetical protein MUF31_15840 [Akkermansiaceae bacterium]|jgi:hypothetical protein|nr:hypothetical protein [Akkermansiaceae bacterium]
MPWQVEGIFLFLIPLAFAFGVWGIVDEVNGKAETLSQVLGIPVDWMSLLMSMKPFIAFAAAVFSVKIYCRMRKWFACRWNAIG